MARRTKTVVIRADNRDKGKHFLITEMPAVRAERWATRAFLALAKSGQGLDGYEPGGGMAQIAVLGFRALSGITIDEADVLMGEMMQCVQFVPTPSQPNFARPLILDEGVEDVEEPATLVYLKAEVFDLHTGFSTAARFQNLIPDTDDPAAGTSESISGLSIFRRQSP